MNDLIGKLQKENKRLRKLINKKGREEVLKYAGAKILFIEEIEENDENEGDKKLWETILT